MRYTDRSRVEAAQNCKRKRFWAYEYRGHGIQRRGFNLDMLVGSATHVGCEAAMGAAWVGGKHSLPEIPLLLACEEAGAAAGIQHFSQAYNELGLQPHMIEMPDGSWQEVDWNQTQRTFALNLVEALVRGWVRVRLPLILAEHIILSIEREEQYQLTEELQFFSRSDFVTRRKADGTEFVWNLKTTKWAEGHWRKKWRYDQQTLSELLGVEQRLGHKVGGVIIEGLVKGQANIEYPKGSGQRFHNSPLMWAWVGPPADPFPQDIKVKYDWVDAEGRNRKLGPTYTRLPSYEVMPMKDWLDKVQKDEPGLLEAQFVTLPPILRSEGEIESWKHSTVASEGDIAARMIMVEGHPENPYELDEQFPKTTSNGNCLGFGDSACPFFQICWEGASPEDAELYMSRVANHPEPVAEPK